jgi:DNA invertase Pin-like site-specific DNA recombinase
MARPGHTITRFGRVLQSRTARSEFLMFLRTEAQKVTLPVAQYLRMSTEHQKYSLDNQVASNREYAERNGFTVIRSYVDAGKSGLVLKHREGLAQLLHDVTAEKQPYQAILVYDISRWGRFQDTDEAAYYEFLCKKAGVPVYYCTETFANERWQHAKRNL